MPSAHASEYCRRMPDGYEVPRWDKYLVLQVPSSGRWMGQGRGRGKGTRAIVGGITK